MSKFSIVNQVNDTLIKEMIELDKLVFQGEDIGAFDKCKEWVETNPDIYTVLTDDNKVIGYINFMPLTEKAYQMVLQGKLKDYQLASEHINQFQSNKPLKCFLTAIAIREEYQDTKAIIELWNGLLNKLNALNLTISSVVADCVSSHGEKLVKQRLDAKFITNSNGGKIYEGNINELYHKY